MTIQNKTKLNLIIILLSVFFSFTVLSLSINNIFWENFFSIFNIQTLWPPFADIRSHQYFSTSVDQGFNPYLEHPNDPWGRPANYPYVWYYITKYLYLVDEKIFLLFIFTIIFFYILCLSKLALTMYKNKFFFIFSILTFFSSSSMLAIERGNSDIILFSIIFFTCFSSYFIFQILLLSISIILKLYPLILSFIWMKNIRDILIFTFIIFLILIFNFNEIQYFMANTSSSYSSGYVYGIKSILNGYPKALSRLNVDFSNYLKLDYLVYLLLILSIFFTFLFGLKQKIKISSNQYLTLDEKLFLSGSTIYVFTFILFSNYDYRLIFLFLTLPYLSQKIILYKDYFFLLSMVISINSLLIFKFANEPMHYLILGSFIHLFKIYIFIYLIFNISQIIKRNLNFLPFKIFKFFV